MQRSYLVHARRVSGRIASAFWQLALMFLLAFVPLSAHADLKDELRLVGERFEKGEITEQQALAQLAVIEKIALEQQKERESLRAAEEAAGSALLRQATIPRVSILGVVWSYLWPLLTVALMIGVTVFFYGSSFGLNRIADWLARLRNYAQRAPSVPPTPRAAPARPSRPAGPSTPPGNLHSGEVPDHLA